MELFAIVTLLAVHCIANSVFAVCPLGSTSQCFCIHDVIDCTRHRVNTIETFYPVPNSEYSTLSLSGNFLRTVSNSSFKNLKIANLFLDNNLISSIEFDAFNELSPLLKVLNLENNKLTTIPKALMNLDVLSTLNLKKNPITSVGFANGDAVFRHLGTSMREFHFGDESQDFWPSTISHFQQLRALYIYGTNMQVAPPHAFHSFERTLRELHITNTQLSIVPNSIGELSRLEELYFDDNINVGDQNIMSASFKSLAGTLHTLSLQNDSLTTFPKILFDLTTLHNLTMDRNKLWYISDDAVSTLNSNITYLSFKQCNLDRIPQSLLRITPLMFLDLTKNNIHSIERDDLGYLSHLRTLIVRKNPLKYVSTEVLRGMNSLSTIDFSDSRLPDIPTAIVNSPTLRTLKFNNSPISCTCDLKWYLSSPFRGKNMTIEGSCETINESIRDYLTYRVPRCP